MSAVSDSMPAQDISPSWLLAVVCLSATFLVLTSLMCDSSVSHLQNFTVTGGGPGRHYKAEWLTLFSLGFQENPDLIWERHKTTK